MEQDKKELKVLVYKYRYFYFITSTLIDYIIYYFLVVKVYADQLDSYYVFIFALFGLIFNIISFMFSIIIFYDLYKRVGRFIDEKL